MDFEIWISDFGLWILEWIPKKLTPMVGWLLVRRRPASRVGFWIWNFVFQIFNFGFWIRSQIFQPQWLGGCWLEGGQGSRGAGRAAVVGSPANNEAQLSPGRSLLAGASLPSPSSLIFVKFKWRYRYKYKHKHTYKYMEPAQSRKEPPGWRQPPQPQHESCLIFVKFKCNCKCKYRYLYKYKYKGPAQSQEEPPGWRQLPWNRQGPRPICVNPDINPNTNTNKYEYNGTQLSPGGGASLLAPPQKRQGPRLGTRQGTSSQYQSSYYWCLPAINTTVSLPHIKICIQIQI